MVQRIRYLGIAEEAEYNPAVPPEAVQHVDIASAALDTPSDPDIVYEGGLGRAARTRRPGFYSPSGNLVYAFDIMSIGRFLKWALGGYAFTEGVDPAQNSHEFYGFHDAELKSFTARLGKDKLTATDFEHVFTGCTVSQLALEVSDSLAQATVDVVAAKDSRDSIKAIEDLILPSGFPIAFHEATVSVDGTAESAKIKSLGLTINNNADAEAGRGLGSRYPRRVVANERSTTFSMELYWNSLDHLQKFWGAVEGVDDSGADEFPLVVTFDAGDAGNLEIKLPKAWYTAAQQQPSGRSELTQSLSGRGLSGTVALADASEVDTDVVATLTNDEAEYTT